jgi:hypothetical protein
MATSPSPSSTYGGLLRTQQEQDMTKLNAKTKKAAKAAKKAPAKKAKAR